MSSSGSWVKLDRTSYESVSNSAFIAVFNWSGKRMFLVYLSKEQYQKQGADYRSATSLRDAKALGDCIETLALVAL